MEDSRGPGDNDELAQRPKGKGSTSFGKYQLFAVLGRGGMADVFLAMMRGPRGFNKLVVLKRLRAMRHDEDDAALAAMFLDEARLSARLQHPNIVNTYEVGEQDGQLFIAMEYLEGQPLNRLVNRAGKGELLSLEMAARIVSDALCGLHYAHELRDYDGTPLEIIHRDISPHNIFVTYDGQVKLVDFGIAKTAMSSQRTETGVLKGKLAYMPMEQAMGEGVERTADVYSMGIVLWELLVGKRMRGGPQTSMYLNQVMADQTPLASTARPDVPPELDAVIQRATAPAKSDRFATAAEMRDAIEAWLSTRQRVPRQEELGRLLIDGFGGERKDVQQQIKQYMSDAGTVTSTLELHAIGTESGSGRNVVDHTPSGARTEVPLNVSVAPEGRVVPLEATTLAGPAPHSSKPKGRGSVLIAFGLLVSAGLAVLLLRGGASNGTVAPLSGTQSAPGGESAKESSTPSTSLPSISASVPVVSAPMPQPPVNEPPPAEKPVASSTAKPGKPKPTKSAASVSASAAETGQGFLTLTTYPWTRVSEGGKPLGVTPLVNVPLSAGTHVLTLENDEQGVKQTHVVTIKNGETVSRSLAFK